MGAIKNRNFDDRSQGGLRDGNGYLAGEISTTSREKWMFFDANDTVTISGRSTVATRFTFAGESHLHVAINACRNCHTLFHAFEFDTIATTCRTLVAHNLSCAAAGRTGGLKSKWTRRLNYLTATLAVIASLWLGSFTRSRAIALTAGLMPSELNRFHDTAGGF